MPSAHISLTVHIIYSTKDRLPLIRTDWRDRLHGYLGGIVKGMNAVPLAISGVEDHVHALVGLKSTHRLDYFVRDLKADSSAWVHQELQKKFDWQKGYAAFSVSPLAVEGVKRYVMNQVEHHRKVSFKEEYLELLNLSGIAYDEKYLW
ncbi:MAG: transposase [Pyrinomonadaceae bacterium]